MVTRHTRRRSSSDTPQRSPPENSPKNSEREVASNVTVLQALTEQLDRFEKFLHKCTDGETIINQQVCLEVEIRLEQAKSILERFNNHVIALKQLNTNVTLTLNVSDFEEKYFNLLALAKNIITEFQSLNKSPSDTSRCSVTPTSSSTENLQIRLPIIELPTYSGDYTSWMSYKDSFLSLVDSKPLPNKHKFAYLRASLKGNAFKVIENILETDSNYSTAWTLLVNRFENRKLIINSHIEAIFNLPSIQRDSFQALRNIKDNLNLHLRALKNLGQPVENWDALIVYLITNKFDTITKKAFIEFQNNPDSLPSVESLNAFLKHRCDMFEQINATGNNNLKSHIIINSNNKEKRDNFISNNKHVFVSTSASITVSCVYCKGNHYLFQCDKFKNLTVDMRFKFVKESKLCKNCLKLNHGISNCKSLHTCKICKKYHHTLLHFSKDKSFSNNASQTDALSTIATVSNVTSSQVLLSTAQIKIKNNNGEWIKARCLLDSGSQSNFITEDLFKKLNITARNIPYKILGINSTISNIEKILDVEIMSCHEQFNMNLSCLVIPVITEKLPAVSFNKNIISLPNDIVLADDHFNESNEIDLLIGVKHFYFLLNAGQIVLSENNLVLQSTKLGWILSGNLRYSNDKVYKKDTVSNDSNFSFSYCCSQCCDDQIKNFWELEEPSNSFSKHNMTSEQQQCEEHFEKNVSRDLTGRFVVKIPFKENYKLLGNSKQQALRRFYLLENKLNKNSELKDKYTEFIHEYRHLKHMSKVDTFSFNSDENLAYYMPHHAICRADSLTTKLRVVFDASAKTDSGLSLNDVQMVGPVVQCDLFSILVRFRKHKIVLTADVMKMYRMILIHPSQRQFQRIIWRDNPSSPLECYQLNTITYGTASAPYLATKCLNYLAEQNKVQYPRTCKIIQNDFYVDDILTGGETVAEVCEIQTEISQILDSAGMVLRKYLSNNKDVLNNVKVDESCPHSILKLGPHETIKTLGITWNSTSDVIQYSLNFNINLSPDAVTKRTILSDTSKIFDPLGLLGPIIINCKLIIQHLWKLKLPWDSPVTPEIYNRWKTLINDIKSITNLQIPRPIICSHYISLELHGFSDSSEYAYGACIYLKAVNEIGNSCVRLICSKSRVAPLKSITIPKLELCGALLLAQLINKVEKALNLKLDKKYCWCDSTIVLSWIHSEANNFKIFVANRVQQIQALTKGFKWLHVNSKENPADLLSRGLSCHHLIENNVWWQGPAFLSMPESSWETKNVFNSIVVNNEDELISQSLTVVTKDLNFDFINDIISKYSSFKTLRNIFAYLFRFLHNARYTTNKRVGPLTQEEMSNALNKVIILVQAQCFAKDINDLKKGKLSSTSKLLSLSPFICDGILRVGGRLRNSNFAFSKKHPILLPSNHKFTELIVSDEHKRLFHAGPTHLLSSIREMYWPLSGKNLVKKICKNCVTCFKANPATSKYIMGDLPNARLTINPPFFNTGVDYSGPYLIKGNSSRKSSVLKGYICLFICMCTKAVHIECVSELTSTAFLAALRRFISRRGCPKNIYSDNGTNFIGAANSLKELFNFLKIQDVQQSISTFLNNQHICWHFIPTKAPHMGGLWEAGIKSAKYHLKRILSNARVTFEELSTVLTQIEAVLNSRPLTALSSDPNDEDALTPGHFLIGRSLVALPDQDVKDIPRNRLAHFQRLQQLIQHFWSRWSKEYVSELQNRTKWKMDVQNIIKEGALVLLVEDNLPPQNWVMGRIVNTFPGKDGVVRVVSIKSRNKIMKRCVNKICVLPVYDEEGQ